MHEWYLPISANDISLRRVSSRSSSASGIRDTNMLETVQNVLMLMMKIAVL